MNLQNRGLFLGAIGVFMFSLTLPVTRHLVQYLDPVFIGFARAVTAAILALLLLIGTQQRFPRKEQIMPLIVIALGIVIGFPTFSAMAMTTLPASHGGVVLAVLPLTTALVSRLCHNERPSRAFWLLSIAGALLVLAFCLQSKFSASANASLSLGSGDLFLLLAVLSAAIGYALGGQLANELGGWQVVCWALVFALPILIIPTFLGVDFIVGSKQNLLETPWEKIYDNLPLAAFFSFAYLAIISQLVGFFFWYKGLALGGIARVSQIQLLQPFITILASAYFLNELIPATTWGFSFAVVITVALSRNTPIFKPTLQKL